MMEITLIGCGAMGSAFAEGLKTSVNCFDHDYNRACVLAKHLGGEALERLTDTPSLFILAVKPQDLEQVAPLLKGFTKPILLVSMLAGIPESTLKKHFSFPVLRIMPNLAVRYGKGIVACSDSLQEPLRSQINTLLAPLGLIRWLPEKQLHAATALAGSGPAFVFAMLEAITEAGLAMGLTSQQALEMACATFSSSLAMIENSDKSLSDLKWSITSPGGTTIAGLNALEENNLRHAIIETFLAAYRRSQELGS